MALVPPGFLGYVVAIGLTASAGPPQYVASGFLFGNATGTTTQEGEKEYRIYLVTNRHVLEGHDRVSIRLNPKGDEAAVDFQLSLEDKLGKKLWTAHPTPDVDVAVVGVNAKLLKQVGMEFGFFTLEKSMIVRDAQVAGLSEGDGVFVLGFPLGLVGKFRNSVIVRQGVIARIRETLATNGRSFLIDSTIFPGNSGGPVLLRPEIAAIEGTNAMHASRLIGIVSGYIPYLDSAFSPQTKRTRVIFEENSGLAEVFTVDSIVEAIEEHRRVLRP